jgi:hypothetical protein
LTLTGHRPWWASAPQHFDFRTIQARPKDRLTLPLANWTMRQTD